MFADPVHALALHRRVLTLDADSDTALTSVARLALATGDTDQALEALRARRDRAEGPSRVAIELEIAQVLLSRTTRWQDALEALRPVLQETPSDPSARALASQLLAHRATRSGAIAMLEQACDASEDADVKEQILTRLLDAPNDADDSSARRGWFERLCDQLRGRGDDEAALAIALRATREMPEVPPLWDRAEELARVLKRADEVAALYGEVLARSLSRDQALSIGERAVQFYEEWFEDPARVVRILERVLELDPAADWAFDRLKLLLDSAERWDDLFALYDRALDHASKSKRAMLLEEAAQTAKDFADRPDRAIQYLEQLHELRPGDPKLVSSLERLYERQGRHRELVALLAARLPAFKRDEARRARTRIAVLWLEELGDPGQALEIIEPLLQHPEEGANGAEIEFLGAARGHPRSVATPARSAALHHAPRQRLGGAPAQVPQVRGAAVVEGVRPSADGRVAARALHANWPRRRSGADAPRRARDRAIDEGARASPHPDRRALREARRPPERARANRRGHDPRPGQRREPGQARGPRRAHGALRAAGRPAVRRGRCLQRGAPHRAHHAGGRGPGRPDRRCGGGHRAVHVGPRGRGGGRCGRPCSRGAPFPLLETAGRNEERLGVLERIAAVEKAPEARRQALGRAAHLALQLGQPGQSIELWERVLAGDEGDIEALDGLVDLLDREGKHARLVEVLTIRARVATGDEKRRADRVRTAKLLGETLERLPEAIDAWHAIERDFGEADDSALALATLLRATRGWRELAELLARRARRTDDEVTRGEFLRQLGDVQREELDAGGEAVTTYERAIEADPSSAGARAGLLALAGAGARRAAALVVLLNGPADPRRLARRARADAAPPARGADGRRAGRGPVRGRRDLGDSGPRTPGSRSRRCAAPCGGPADDRTWSETARLAEASGAWEGLVATYREAVGGAAHSMPA